MDDDKDCLIVNSTIVPSSNSTLVLSSNSTLISSSNSPYPSECGDRIPILVFSVFCVCNALLILPLNTWILWLVTWPAATTTTTTKTLMVILTANLAAIEICISLFGMLFTLGYHLKVEGLLITAIIGTGLMVGRPLLHCCTCLERYLAVVHPLAYRYLQASRYRCLCPVLVWLFALGNVWITYAYSPNIPKEPLLAEFLFTTLVMCFCSVAVLKALKRPGPGEGSGDKEKTNESKRRAFKTIILILGALMVSFGAFIISMAMMVAGVEKHTACIVAVSGHFFTVPSCLVQPLLFLHRAGKLPHCRSQSHTP